MSSFRGAHKKGVQPTKGEIKYEDPAVGMLAGQLYLLWNHAVFSNCRDRAIKTPQAIIPLDILCLLVLWTHTPMVCEPNCTGFVVLKQRSTDNHWAKKLHKNYAALIPVHDTFFEALSFQNNAALHKTCVSASSRQECHNVSIFLGRLPALLAPSARCSRHGTLPPSHGASSA